MSLLRTVVETIVSDPATPPEVPPVFGWLFLIAGVAIVSFGVFMIVQKFRGR